MALELFPSDGAAVTALTARINLMRGQFPIVPDPALLIEQLQAAEGEARRKLGIFLRPTEVFSVVAPAGEVAALEGKPYVIEPAYDMPPDWFQVGSFGMLKLNHPQVSKVTSLELRHPSYQAEAYKIPIEWVQLVGRAGLINVVAGGAGASSLPLNIFTLQAMGSGYTIPHMIRVRYTCGLTDEFKPEVVKLVHRTAILSLLADAFTPQSGSISADGLSRSTSQDLSKHRGEIDDAFAGLRERIHGPIWGVV